MNKAQGRGVDISSDQQCSKCLGCVYDKLSCLVCPKQFKSKQQLAQHCKDHSISERTLQCASCKSHYVFLENKRFVADASQSHTGEKPL